ncbi:hypothetical protein RUM43_009813 [Polyplax serrata]|uniref:Endoplasmic reticulum lectin 1 n=1 Tax=Polyplax serrata TaxID=468196 RepID=A0AAN8S6X1_POLSC
MILKLIICHLFVPIINIWGLEEFDPNLKGFDDSILFKINWPGKDGIANENFDVPEFQQMTVMTEDEEKYKCIIPQMQVQEKEKKYNGVIGTNPLDLLSVLFKQSSCSHKLEAYWTYELCHGKYIRQYHEEREGKTVKLQEYYLGMWDANQQQKLRKQLEEEAAKVSNNVPIKKVDGLNMPYLQINMTDGTLCELSSKPRQTKVLYICYIHGKHEIYSLKETSICEYEVIVLSPLLCHHPKYRPQESGENVINCHPLDNSPKKPKNLLQLEAESLKLMHQKANDVSHLRVEIHPIDTDEDVDSQSSVTMPYSSDSESSVDLSLHSFLSGSDCIQGNFVGWWKCEFCYGKYIIQYHVEKDGSKTVMNLGNFVKSAHLEWLQSNPHKRPEPLSVRRYVSHFYSGGTICGKTGKPRHTEVKLKCLEGKYSEGAVSIYLLEPKVCQYILVVESKKICHLLTKIDENGLYEPKEEIGFSKASYKNGYQPYMEHETSTPQPAAVFVVEDEDEAIVVEEEVSGKVQPPEDKTKTDDTMSEEEILDNHIPDGDE